MSLSEEFQNMNINLGRSPLSVDDLSDPGATPTRKVSESNTRNGRFLIKAFKDFILPIVHAQGSGLGIANRKSNPNEDTDAVRLGPAAQQLVDALENFFTSLISPEVPRKDEARREEGSDVLENRHLVPSLRSTIGTTQSRSLILSKAPKRPRLLTLALEAARHRVFNRMPIRLLSFKSDGSGIRLRERSDTWDYVSTSIEAEFDEGQLRQDIERRNYPTYNPGAEKEVIESCISSYTGYAILSHTWLHDKPGEVTYGDWKDGNFNTDSPGYQKLSNFLRIAAADYGYIFAWMDTICINKDSSAELDESIRSMFKWYGDASICITYLAQTTTLADMHNDAWFTRGWTLQELLAPRYIKFYGADWQKLNTDSPNDKWSSRVQAEILAATTITPAELIDIYVTPIPVSRKMQWAANRQVTREEDATYSLMGLFGVSLSTAYGEGAKLAFFRLAQQILNSKEEVLDLLNWGYGPDLMSYINDTQTSSHPSSLIPSGPQQYLWRAANITKWPVPSVPVTLTHLGLHLSVVLMPAISAADPLLYPFYPIGDYYGSVTFDVAVVDWYAQNGVSPGLRYNVLDMASYHPIDGTVANRHQITFAVLNFGASETEVGFQTLDRSKIPCFAVALSFDTSAYITLASAAIFKRIQVLQTQTAITFDLRSPLHEGGPLPPWVRIPKKDLARHGMQLLDMYL